MNTNKNIAGKLLTYTFVVFLFAIGADKIMQANVITDWQTLVGPLTNFLLPRSAGNIVMVEGVVEIMLGVLLLTTWKRTALVILIVTICIIVVDLFALHYNNLAIREIILIIVCVAMYLLDEKTPEIIKSFAE